jgi:hypothetical protein
VPPGNRRAVGHRVEKRLAALGIRDLFQLLRQIEIIPADRGEDTIWTLKHAKRLRRSHVHGCGAAEIHLDRGSAIF